MNFYLVQANTITSAFNESFGIEKWVTAVIIFGGIKMIAKASVVIVPIMAGAYVLVALIIIVVMNVTELQSVFVLIFESAFGLREVAGGELGAVMLQVIKRVYFQMKSDGYCPYWFDSLPYFVFRPVYIEGNR
ncbi:alanine:cation symporter family protein [Peribacillus simplex]|uniref:alanine:cation symporter family protein n=1 Tax=Peribacillus TaxID=2675229 RepID=UPI00177B7E97|nr:alanine:cation symporter family protein [Brevibacillus sp. JNUCC-41]QOS89351.1 alanine:cation symporter family protein [Brevibacillus sp. JNUCC-41]